MCASTAVGLTKTPWILGCPLNGKGVIREIVPRWCFSFAGIEGKNVVQWLLCWPQPGQGFGSWCKQTVRVSTGSWGIWIKEKVRGPSKKIEAKHATGFKMRMVMGYFWPLDVLKREGKPIPKSVTTMKFNGKSLKGAVLDPSHGTPIGVIEMESYDEKKCIQGFLSWIKFQNANVLRVHTVRGHRLVILLLFICSMQVHIWIETKEQYFFYLKFINNEII